MNFGNVCSGRVDLFFLWGGGGGGGLIFETNCIFEYKPSPHFRLDVVYKVGGRINGTLRYNLHLDYKAINSVRLFALCNTTGKSSSRVCLCLYSSSRWYIQ